MKTITNKRKYLTNVETFTNKFANPALQMEKKYGLPAVAILAQIALETGWGKKVLKVRKPGSDIKSEKFDSKNLFNIKASRKWNGKVGVAYVLEIIKGKKVYLDQKFRVYDTYGASFDDYAGLITGVKRYKKAVEVADINNPFPYIDEIFKAGYATDPDYVSKMKSIIRKNWEISDDGNDETTDEPQEED